MTAHIRITRYRYLCGRKKIHRAKIEKNIVNRIRIISNKIDRIIKMLVLVNDLFCCMGKIVIRDGINRNVRKVFCMLSVTC